MGFKNLVRLLVKRQKENFRNLSKYGTVQFSHHSSRTLGKDDVRLAEKWLKNKTQWDQKEPVERFERDFAKWNGSKYALAYMSGREALSAGIYGLDLKGGDEIIVPAYTCVVVPNAFKYAGVNITYVDIELDTYGIDINDLKSKISTQTKVILLHHLFGLVCRDFEKILTLAEEYEVKIIEDCAHATGAMFKGKKVGNFGDIAFYSTEQSKVLNTVQGGIITTNNSQIYSRLTDHYNQAPYPDSQRIEKQLYTLLLFYYQFNSPFRWFLAPFYQNTLKSYKLVSTTEEELIQKKPSYYGRRMPAPIAAIGLNQLRKTDRFNELRRMNAKKWNKWCLANGYKKPTVIKDSNPVWLRYPVLVEPEKKQNIDWAREQLGVKLGIWFKSCLHPSKIELRGEFPNARTAVNKCINFPTL